MSVQTDSDIWKGVLHVEIVKCVSCNREAEWYREEDEGKYCPSCYADLVGISTSEVWACIV